MELKHHLLNWSVKNSEKEERVVEGRIWICHKIRATSQEQDLFNLLPFKGVWWTNRISIDRIYNRIISNRVIWIIGIDNKVKWV